MRCLLIASLALSLATLASQAQNISGSLGTLSIGPYVTNSTGVASGSPSTVATLPLTVEYQNTTPAGQDSLAVTVQQLPGPGPLTSFFGRSQLVTAYGSRSFAAGSITTPAVGSYLFQVTGYVYNRQFHAWGTSTQRTYWLYVQQPLAVELASFSYQTQATGTWLKWRTASEKDNDRFEVERSPDGLDFERLATVAGHGTTSQAHTYTWLDTSPGALLRYYRLRQVDHDGTAAYSPVLVVQPAGQRVLLWPNPARELVHVPPGEVRIYDLAGHLVLHQLVPASGELPLNLPPGSYAVQAGDQRQRLVIF